jgi:hypothetical protein
LELISQKRNLTSSSHRSCRKFIERIHRNAMNGKSSLGNRQPHGELIGCALWFRAMRWKFMLVRVDLKSDRSLISGCARKLGWTESVLLLFPAAGQLSAAGCLPVRNKHDQRRPINRERCAEKGKQLCLVSEGAGEEIPSYTSDQMKLTKGEKEGRPIESGLVPAKERFLLCL